MLRSPFCENQMLIKSSNYSDGIRKKLAHPRATWIMSGMEKAKANGKEWREVVAACIAQNRI